MTPGSDYGAVMGGETAVGGKEVVVVMQQIGIVDRGAQYRGIRLLATSRTSTMQKEMQAGGRRRVIRTSGRQCSKACLVARKLSSFSSGIQRPLPQRYQYRLLATTKTSTLERELKDAADGAYDVVGMTVAKTLVGGKELVTIARRRIVK